ncbi:MAG TPA: class I SAM-dependent methyltransferase [Burkholderiales bacterium]|nr:class I SAM-dependent methyltransferase [Burkholderiales bacterium]
MKKDVWAAGDLYEPYVGRWSRVVAKEFLGWLGVPREARWLDVGCGTGALTQTILRDCAPRSVHGVDPSAGFVEFARQRTNGASFEVGDAQALAAKDGEFDAAVAGLVLNFVSKPERAAGEMRRAVRPGGKVGVYVWDYAGKMELMRYFWDAAVELDAAARALDEGVRFPLCKEDALAKLFREAGMHHVQVRVIDAPTPFRDFDDYWTPFIGGQGPAPGYCMSLDETRRATLRDRIRSTLPFRRDGSIHLVARAWAVKGTVG